jgi:hypothetical protein
MQNDGSGSGLLVRHAAAVDFRTDVKKLIAARRWAVASSPQRITARRPSPPQPLEGPLSKARLKRPLALEARQRPPAIVVDFAAAAASLRELVDC